MAEEREWEKPCPKCGRKDVVMVNRETGVNYCTNSTCDWSDSDG